MALIITLLHTQVIWKGVQIKPLFTYLRKLQIKRTEHLQPVKLILLGQQGCGKTTLNRTISSAAKCPTSSDNTQKASLHNYLSAEEKSNLMKRLPRDELIENIEEPNRYNSKALVIVVGEITPNIKYKSSKIVKCYLTQPF